MTGPEQHAAALRVTIERAYKRGKALYPIPADAYDAERDAALAELDELVALAGRADCGGVNCGKCQQCLTVHEFFLKEAVENGDKLLSQAGRALEAAEARADELQGRLYAIENMPPDGYLAINVEAMRPSDELEQARREAEQLRAALREIEAKDSGAHFKGEPRMGDIARAALAGVQADSKDSA